MKKRPKITFLVVCSHLITDVQFFFTDYNVLGSHGCYATILVALGYGVRVLRFFKILFSNRAWMTTQRWNLIWKLDAFKVTMTTQKVTKTHIFCCHIFTLWLSWQILEPKNNNKKMFLIAIVCRSTLCAARQRHFEFFLVLFVVNQCFQPKRFRRSIVGKCYCRFRTNVFLPFFMIAHMLPSGSK